VTSTTHDHQNYIKGSFTATVCPVVTLDKYLESH
jgi:hypothetical protein